MFAMSDSPLNSPHFFSKDTLPNVRFETDLIETGLRHICGVDEAGRGPLAGPVTAAAVILDMENIPDGLHDSKKLNEKKREVLFDKILDTAIVSYAHCSAKSIDEINIRAASLKAMERAIRGLTIPSDHALIDGNAVPPHLPCPASAIVKGDARSLSIAAASIIAKVVRDRMMQRSERFFPGYGLAGHKGYPTKSHREALMIKGATNLHRQTFGPVALANASKSEPELSKQ